LAIIKPECHYWPDR